MAPLVNVSFNHSSPYILGSAVIEQKEIDEAVKSIIHELSNPLLDHCTHKKNWDEVSVPEYLTEMNLNQGDRYYAETLRSVHELDPSIPYQNLLISLSQRISALNFPCDTVALRFEKGCFNPLVSHWHQDFTNIEGLRFISLCYSNVKNWSTKILDDSAMLELKSIPTNPDFKTLRKIEELATNSEFGVFYDVINLYHRSPVREDFPSHVLASDYRLFIRFNNLQEFQLT